MPVFINPSMLVMARESRGYNQADLAGLLKMSPTNLSKIERGEVRVSPEVLDRILETTGFPLSFFQQGGHAIPDQLWFRRRLSVPQKEILAINARANIFLKHVRFLAEALDKASGGLTRTEKWLRERGNDPISDLTSNIESLGIPVMRFDFGTERVDSKSLRIAEGMPLIFVNEKLSGDRQRFSLAFELAHFLLMEKGPLSDHEKHIHECNALAASILMPEKAIRDDFASGVSIERLAEMKKKWKVSMISLLYRADDLQIISANQKRYLLQQFNKMQIRRREPVELDVQYEEPGLIRHWVQSYMSRHGLNKLEMAAILCMEAGEFLEYYG